ncbi:MAG: hypothetical protein ACRERU_09915 [Methylococcales bacterium]
MDARFPPIPKVNCHYVQFARTVPTVKDRVLQTAVTRMLTPVFEAEFEECSFAYRKGWSVEQAVERVIHLRDEGYSWVVDADIHAFSMKSTTLY